MSRIDELIEQVRCLEAEIQVEFDKKREGFRFAVEDRRIRFSEEVAQLQRSSKVGLIGYVFRATLLTWLSAPVIYLGFALLLLLDLYLLVCQAVCFPVYRIRRRSARTT